MCMLLHMKWIACLGLMPETGCSGLVHWDDPRGWDGEGGGTGVLDGETYVPVSDFVDVNKNHYNFVK